MILKEEFFETKNVAAGLDGRNDDRCDWGRLVVYPDPDSQFQYRLVSRSRALGLVFVSSRVLPGMTAGFMWGLLNILIGSAMRNFITVPQIIFEYPFAFAFGGMGGLFANKIQQAIRQNSKTVTWYVVLGASWR